MTGTIWKIVNPGMLRFLWQRWLKLSCCSYHLYWGLRIVQMKRLFLEAIRNIAVLKNDISWSLGGYNDQIVLSQQARIISCLPQNLKLSHFQLKKDIWVYFFDKFASKILQKFTKMIEFNLKVRTWWFIISDWWMLHIAWKWCQDHESTD